MQRKSLGDNADIADIREGLNAEVGKEVDKEVRSVDQQHYGR